MPSLTIEPAASFRQACELVDQLHRHHRRPQGHKFSLVARIDGELVGVAIIGRPVARHFDDGRTLEVTRLATNGARNVCSALYRAAWDGTRGIRFGRIITYTQTGESGASLRAAGWIRLGELAPRKGWDVPSRPRADRGTDNVARILWTLAAKDAPALAIDCPEKRPERTRCEGCGEPFPTNRIGRPRRYCDEACRRRAYRRRGA